MRQFMSILLFSALCHAQDIHVHVSPSNDPSSNSVTEFATIQRAMDHAPQPGPGNYNWDISLRRSFPLHLGESSRLSLQGDLYNVTNHTQFTVASPVFGNASFGQVSGTQANTRRSAQLSARIDF